MNALSSPREVVGREVFRVWGHDLVILALYIIMGEDPFQELTLTLFSGACADVRILIRGSDF
jgi:hypothetical protein